MPELNHRSFGSRCVIASHITIVLVTGFVLSKTHNVPIVRGGLTFFSGMSLFVLTGLVHEASHHLLSRRTWINDLLGNLAGTPLVTPVSAYRALHLKHHQTTNHDDDPNKILKSRWMLLVGAPTYVMLTHQFAWRHLRGRAMVHYLLELVGMLGLIAVVCLLPRHVREWSIINPLIVVAILQNVRIVTGHMDLPSGKYHDTWQLILPDWLSIWLLHYDHHLEHHLRPRLHWYDLPAIRAKLVGEPGLPLQRVTLTQFFVEVYFSRRFAVSQPTISHAVVDGS